MCEFSIHYNYINMHCVVEPNYEIIVTMLMMTELDDLYCFGGFFFFNPGCLSE